MNYPTLTEVADATHFQLARWHRFLRSPGDRAIGQPDFHAVVCQEADVLGEICRRLKSHGGITPGISKALGLQP